MAAVIAVFVLYLVLATYVFSTGDDGPSPGAAPHSIVSTSRSTA
ncbi:hypothetical protein AB0I34_30425 [Kribbella sp. NPDC050281]